MMNFLSHKYVPLPNTDRIQHVEYCIKISWLKNQAYQGLGELCTAQHIKTNMQR
jgi:hypothetical protein